MFFGLLSPKKIIEKSKHPRIFSHFNIQLRKVYFLCVRLALKSECYKGGSKIKCD